MFVRSSAIAAAVCAATFATPVLAERSTPQYTSLTVFGDSLVDAGNIYTLTGGLTPNPAAGYFQGRFTNGYDYTDLLSIDLFGTPTVASLQGGTNYAFGGARATTTSPVPDLAEQLALFSGNLAFGRTVDSNGLYVLNFGGNDIFNAPPPGAGEDAFLMMAASNYAQGVQYLNDLGVRNFLITGFPVLDDPASYAAEGYLTTALGNLNLASDTTLYRFSYLDFFQRVLVDPGSLGLPPQNTTVTCRAAGPAAIANGCVGYFSFDGVHPTAPIHQAIYADLQRQFNLSGAVPEPATWAMLIIGFFAAGSAMRHRPRAAVRFART
ncbi:SGNH/GDSL hydrolase family protein [Qipengyuania sp.]|uniref:SGNH/GDSL hydrolase family protein n=1 Tax=Qipengyuania sp. TaxID=2004515 RepID=UPI0035C87CB6